MWLKFGQMAGKAISKIKKTKVAKMTGKGLSKTDKFVAQNLGKVGEGYGKVRSKIKATGTYKDIRSLAKKTPISFGEGAKAFTIGAGIAGLAQAGYNQATGYEFVRKKKEKKGYKTTNLDLGKYSYKIDSYK